MVFWLKMYLECPRGGFIVEEQNAFKSGRVSKVNQIFTMKQMKEKILFWFYRLSTGIKQEKYRSSVAGVNDIWVLVVSFQKEL